MRYAIGWDLIKEQLQVGQSLKGIECFSKKGCHGKYHSYPVTSKLPTGGVLGILQTYTSFPQRIKQLFHLAGTAGVQSNNKLILWVNQVWQLKYCVNVAWHVYLEKVIKLLHIFRKMDKSNRMPSHMATLHNWVVSWEQKIKPNVLSHSWISRHEYEVCLQNACSYLVFESKRVPD